MQRDKKRKEFSSTEGENCCQQVSGYGSTRIGRELQSAGSQAASVTTRQHIMREL